MEHMVFPNNTFTVRYERWGIRAMPVLPGIQICRGRGDAGALPAGGRTRGRATLPGTAAALEG